MDSILKTSLLSYKHLKIASHQNIEQIIPENLLQITMGEVI